MSEREGERGEGEARGRGWVRTYVERAGGGEGEVKETEKEGKKKGERKEGGGGCVTYNDARSLRANGAARSRKGRRAPEPLRSTPPLLFESPRNYCCYALG